MDDSNLVCLSDTDCPTYYHFTGNSASVIDLTFCSHVLCQRASCIVVDDLEGNHRAVVSEFSFARRVYTAHSAPPWKLRGADKKAFADKCDVYFSPYVCKGPSMSDRVAFFTDGVRHVAMSTVGKCRPSTGYRVQKSWWSREIDRAVKERKRLRKSWQKTCMPLCLIAYRTASVGVRGVIKKAKLSAWKAHCEHLSESTDSSKFWKLFKSSHNEQRAASITSLVDSTNRVVSET